MTPEQAIDNVRALAKRQGAAVQAPLFHGSAMHPVVALELAEQIQRDYPSARVLLRPFDWYVEMKERGACSMYLQPTEYQETRERLARIQAFRLSAESEVA